MDSATARYNPSHAKWLLSRLDREHPIDAVSLEDEAYLECRTCGVRLDWSGTRHDPYTIRALRAAAGDGWPNG